MEMKPGYKLTEVGVVPQNWEVKPLRDFATVVTGSTPPTADSANYGDEFMFVSPADMGESKFIMNTEKRLSRKGFSISRRFPKDSVLFVCIGSTIGKCGVASVDLTSNQQINAVLPSATFSADFIYYAVSAVAPRVRALAGEQAVPLVNKSQFSETQLALPPMPEQRAIAATLSDVDALLRELDRLISKKIDLKQAAMQQLLTGETRLPGFHAEWESVTLAAVIDALDAGVSVNSVEDDHGDSYYDKCILKTSAVSGGRFIPRECKRIALKDLSRACLNPAKGTIIISRMNTPDLVGECGYVDRDYPNLFVPDRLWMTRFNRNLHVSGQWLSYLLSTAVLKRQIKAAATGTSGSMKNLSKHAFLRIPIALPSGLEQSAIAEVLSDLDAEIAALERCLDKTRALKQGMMQELLTGRTRLI
jgi:type I restriction enzyme S subunit